MSALTSMLFIFVLLYIFISFNMFIAGCKAQYLKYMTVSDYGDNHKKIFISHTHWPELFLKSIYWTIFLTQPLIPNKKLVPKNHSFGIHFRGKKNQFWNTNTGILCLAYIFLKLPLVSVSFNNSYIFNNCYYQGIHF